MRILVLFLLTALPLAAQGQTTSGKTRPGDNTNAQGNVLGERPQGVLDVVKLKGVISAVDTTGRTVSVKPNKREESLVLTFPQPAGREQIKTSKKAAKILGKKKLSLEELKVGAKVDLRYYPALSQVMELVVNAS